MKKVTVTPKRHVLLLALFCILQVCVWMLPVILVGHPDQLPGLTERASDFLATGVLGQQSGRLPVLIVSLFLPLIDLGQINMWMLVSAITFALALACFWFATARLFDRTVAWISTVILAFMPLHWVEIMRVNGYPFAFLFLFLGFALFAVLQEEHRLRAVCAFGLCFGAVLGSIDAFLTFLPWFCIAYLWLERSHYKQGLLHVGVFLASAYVAFMAPMLFTVANTEGTLSERLVHLLPSSSNATAGAGHLYPDDWTFAFDREAYDTIIQERSASADFITKQTDANYRHMYGVSRMNPLELAFNGAWLFLNTLPDFFMGETVGGAFLWLFILPGILVAYRRHRTLLFLLTGLWLSVEFLLRFVLHFGRGHVMDYAWGLALLAALGVVFVATAIVNQRKNFSLLAVCTVILVTVSVQMLQANRKQFARLYARSNVVEAFAAGEALGEIADDAIIALPRARHLTYFSDHESHIIHDNTIDRLDTARLREPFLHHGVTHIIGYSEERTRKIKKANPRVQVIEIPKTNAVSVSPLTKYLLHVIR